MNFRNTIILVVILFTLGAYVYFREVKKPTESVDTPPWFYTMDIKDINTIKVRYQGKTTDLWWDNNESLWHFRDSNQEVDQGRVNGIRLLLSGPRSKRILVERPENLSLFGLDKPQIEATIAMEGGQTFTVWIGGETPDKGSHYARFKGYDAIYLIDRSWGDELARFVTEPPIPSPTTTAGGG